ncbi:MAG: BMP family protein [Caldilineales bacterium]|nr:BMP family protein [Caldilineales bacterium]
MLPFYKRALTFLFLSLALLGLLVGCAPVAAPPEPAKEAPPAKVAMLMAVSCDDSGWGTPGCEGIKQAATKYGIEYSISEKVAIADAEAAVRDYAARGYNLIIGHGFQYGDAIGVVAPDFPDTSFAIYAGYAEGQNITPIDPKNHENGYLAGIVAGHLTKSKVIGSIGGFDIPTVVRVLEGYCLGAQSVDPSIRCIYNYPGNWADVQKGAEAAQAMMDAGADVFFHDASLTGVGMLQAATEAGKYGIGFGTCQDAIHKDLIATSALDGIAETMVLAVDMFMEGKLVGGQTLRPQMADGIFTLCPYSGAVPQAAKDAVETARQQIVSGELVVEEISTPSN